MRYSKEPRTRKDFKRYGVSSFARNLFNKYGRKLLHIALEAELDTSKTPSEKVVHKTVKDQVNS